MSVKQATYVTSDEQMFLTLLKVTSTPCSRKCVVKTSPQQIKNLY